MNKHRLLEYGEVILATDEYLSYDVNSVFAASFVNDTTSWLKTGLGGATYQKDAHRPHRRLISEPTPTPTPPMNTPSLARYRIVNLPKTKPVRCMVLIDNKVYVEGVTHAVAREIVVGHLLSTEPDLASHQAIVRDLVKASGL